MKRAHTRAHTLTVVEPVGFLDAVAAVLATVCLALHVLQRVVDEVQPRAEVIVTTAAVVVRVTRVTPDGVTRI